MAGVVFGEAKNRLQQAKQDIEAKIAELNTGHETLSSAAYTNAQAVDKVKMLHTEMLKQNRVIVRVLQILVRLLLKLDKL